ncbi:hypothetical protein PMAYCL1PPCAC_03098, partial [Pristionchus mayeri]
ATMCSILMCILGSQIAAKGAAAAAAGKMAKKQRPGRCCTITMIILGVLLVVLGLLLLIPFPISWYPALVKSQIPLIERKDGSYTKLTGFWQNLPQLATYDFYFFNITNMDEMIYEGAKAHLVEVGPYAYMETEFKEGIQWMDDNMRVYYRSNKTWVFRPDLSCTGCMEDDVVTLPNAAYATTLALKAQNDMPPNVLRLLDLLLQALGENPMSSVTVGGILFNAYDDPFLDLVNSNITKLLVELGGGTLGGVPVPDIPYMGYFPHYNHTNDEDYVVRTGQDDPMMAFQIEKWAGQDRLSWWSGEAAEFKGAGDGTFYKPFIEDDDVLMNFQSFACRAYNMEVSHHEQWTGIDATVFTFAEDSYDSNKEHNIGYRYENLEYIDYFPDWPTCGPNHTYQPWAMGDKCVGVDCRFDVNFCSDCCDGSHYERTIFMPPGIVPLRCLPGQNKRLPFAGFLSPPHFSSSPSQVHDMMVGLAPDPVKHEMGRWWINTITGGTVHALFNMQLTIPIYNDEDFMLTTHMRNSFLPSFWTHIDANLKPYAHDFIVLSAQTVPSVVLGLGISFLILAVIFFAIAFCCFRRGRKREDEEEVFHTFTYNVSTEDEKKPAAVQIRPIADAEQRRESPAQKYPELYEKESPESSLSWKSRTLQHEGATEEAWS